MAKAKIFSGFTIATVGIIELAEDGGNLGESLEFLRAVEKIIANQEELLQNYQEYLEFAWTNRYDEVDELLKTVENIVEQKN